MIQADMNRRNNNLLLYLLLNVLVSAGTTLAVLFVWDYLRPPELPPPPPGGTVAEPVQSALVETATPGPTATLPPVGEAVIEIRSVIGVGDLAQEVVLLQRLGEGNLLMTGWRLEGEYGNVFIFPTQPELTLFKDGAVQVFSCPGDDTATEVYWDRSEPAWQRGETVRLFDTQGIERASYAIP
jgi:hypothetical protein